MPIKQIAKIKIMSFKHRKADQVRFPHVHVIHAGKSALIDLRIFSIIENNGFSEKTLKQVIEVLQVEQENLLEAWEEYNG